MMLKVSSWTHRYQLFLRLVVNRLPPDQENLKGILQQKEKLLSSFTHQYVPNLMTFFLPSNLKKNISSLQKLYNIFVQKCNHYSLTCLFWVELPL